MNKTIIVCDDDLGITEVTQIVLKDAGYNVITVNDSSKVFNIVKATQPSLLLIDLWMPHLNGEEITKKIKKDPKTKNIPVVVFSASKDTKEVCEKIGANDYLLKPFDIVDLESKVKQFT